MPKCIVIRLMATIKYLIAKDTDFQWGLVTKTVGLQDVVPGSPYPPKGHPEDHDFQPEGGRILQDIHILYIIKGQGWFSSTHQPTTRINAGDVVVLFPNEWHTYSPDPATGWTETWIGFTGELAEQLLEKYGFSPADPIRKVGVSNKLIMAFEQAYDVAEKQLPAYQQQLAGYVGLIISTVYAKSLQQPYLDNPDTDLINLSMKIMRQNLNRIMLMEEVAAEIGMGYSKFRKVFKDYTGFSPTQYFLRLKMEQAKDYLLNTSLSSKEIAYRLGFDSVSYFIKVFHQHHGLTPSDLRRQFGRLKN